MMKIHFITAVWGDSYTDLFLNVALPNQLSPGNLPSFYHSSGKGSIYKIYTMFEDAEKIKKSPVFAELSGAMSTEIVLIDDLNVKIKHNALSECHKRAIGAADNDGAALAFLSPDSIWSDGTFANLLEIVATGKRVVMVAGIRVVKETFVPTLLQQFRSKSDFSISISSRELVKIALDHLHPVTKSLFWNSKEFSGWPSHLYWDVNQEGLLARCFHLHPLVVNPSRRGLSFSSTIDADYFSLACPDLNDLYVVVDSDEMVCCEISSLAQSAGTIAPNGSSVIQVARWARHQTNQHHREFVRHRIRFHFKEISEDWQQVERSSDRVVDATCRLLKMMNRVRNYCKTRSYCRWIWVHLRSIIR